MVMLMVQRALQLYGHERGSCGVGMIKVLPGISAVRTSWATVQGILRWQLSRTGQDGVLSTSDGFGMEGWVFLLTDC